MLRTHLAASEAVSPQSVYQTGQSLLEPGWFLPSLNWKTASSVRVRNEAEVQLQQSGGVTGTGEESEGHRETSGAETRRHHLVLQGSLAAPVIGGPRNGTNLHHLHQEPSFDLLIPHHFAST